MTAAETPAASPAPQTPSTLEGMADRRTLWEAMILTAKAELAQTVKDRSSYDAPFGMMDGSIGINIQLHHLRALNAVINAPVTPLSRSPAVAHEVPAGVVRAAQDLIAKLRDAPTTQHGNSTSRVVSCFTWAELIDAAEALDAALTSGAGGAVAEGWRPMSEEPVDRPITARMKLMDGSWWYARVKAWRYENGDGGRLGDHGYELLHYNGNVAMGRFYGPFDSWCEVDSALSATTPAPQSPAVGLARTVLCEVCQKPIADEDLGADDEHGLIAHERCAASADENESPAVGSMFDDLTVRQKLIAETLFNLTAGGADDMLMDLAASIACAQAVAVDTALASAPPAVSSYQSPAVGLAIDEVKWENAVLRAALSALPGIAEECRVKWDAGMKAGKLLIALTDPTLRYRADITELHRVAALPTKREESLEAEIATLRRDHDADRGVPEELVRLSAAATPGPWYDVHRLNVSHVAAKTKIADVYSEAYGDWAGQVSNASFMTAAANWVRSEIAGKPFPAHGDLPHERDDAATAPSQSEETHDVD